MKLPDRFTIERQLASIVRVRVETVLSADAPGGLQVRLLLVPFGRQAGGSFDSDEQLELATYFLDSKQRGEPSRISALMAGSAARSPGVLEVVPVGSAIETGPDANGRRYARETASHARWRIPNCVPRWQRRQNENLA